MTTMFVQLRRVVYLLVLLQCCVYVACKEGEDRNVDVDEFLKNYNPNDREMERAAEKVQLYTNAADRMLGEGRTTLLVWKKKVDSCNDTRLSVKKATDAVVGLANEMKLYTDPAGKGEKRGYVLKSGVKGEALLLLVDKIKKVLGGKDDAPNETEKSIDYANVAGKACLTSLMNMEDVLNNLNSSRGGLLSFGEEDVRKNQTLAVLLERSKNVHEELIQLQNDTNKERLRAAQAVSDAREQIKAWNGAMTELKLMGAVGEARGDQLNGLGGSREKIVEGLKTIKESSTDRLEKFKDFRMEDNKKNRKGDAVKEINATVIEANTTEMGRIAEQRRKEEEDRVRRAEEEARRGAEEKARKAQEEARRVAQEERQKQAAAEAQRAKEEQERRKREEQAKREKEEQAKKEREEKAKRDAEEESKRIAEEKAKNAAKKKKDGAVTPFLMHGPLFLLLMCVLGCTLVC
ncbi:uncharacterized protein TM35_000432020 [Trypanosoma theileri]|uniref:Uncharacterized protein n=1 Tax=Trypanosoma theileri TaxID=67003 RepID=A0A1X0NIP2_9TRYP|nr:uncharacterized protein TM35_000432020 [Trypanosoma theileri]ORC84634.1 hypothetical protein TM35_000432020 [Trypanosoma theileri]